jgi:uncharacterized protein (TIGR02246 family)
MLCSGLLVLLICTGAPSDDKTPDKNAEAVGKAFASLAKAYNARDPKALAEMFTPNGEFIDADENVFQGRDAIAREFTALFEINPKNSVEIVADDIREISPGVLSVDCEATMSIAEGKPAAGTKETAGAKETVMVDFVALLVKQADGRWLLASIRSEGERSLSTPHARLKQLEWLIGDWVDESDDRSRCRPLSEPQGRGGAPHARRFESLLHTKRTTKDWHGQMRRDGDRHLDALLQSLSANFATGYSRWKDWCARCYRPDTV